MVLNKPKCMCYSLCLHDFYDVDGTCAVAVGLLHVLLARTSFYLLTLTVLLLIACFRCLSDSVYESVNGLRQHEAVCC